MRNLPWWIGQEGRDILDFLVKDMQRGKDILPIATWYGVFWTLINKIASTQTEGSKTGLDLPILWGRQEIGPVFLGSELIGVWRALLYDSCPRSLSRISWGPYGQVYHNGAWLRRDWKILHYTTCPYTWLSINLTFIKTYVNFPFIEQLLCAWHCTSCWDITGGV